MRGGSAGAEEPIEAGVASKASVNGTRRSEKHIMHITKPRPKPEPSSADVAERRVVSIGVRSSGNLCVEEEYA